MSDPAPTLQIKLLLASAQAPKRGSAFAAGYDLFAAAATTIPARGKGLVSTGISMAVPEGTYGRIAPRSGLASKHHIDTGAGVIDADYRGEVKVLLFNHAETDFEVQPGDRVAQLIIERIYTPEVTVVQELAESVRGAGGFGSTGFRAGDSAAATGTGHDSHGAGGAGGISVAAEGVETSHFVEPMIPVTAKDIEMASDSASTVKSQTTAGSEAHGAGGSGGIA